MRKILSEHWKRYLVSSLVTFVGGFSAVLLVNLSTLSLEVVKDGGLIGFLFLGVRGGVKAVLEVFVAKINKTK